MTTAVADRLDLAFAALAHPARRAIVARLADGDATLTELAVPFAMSVPAVAKHLKVLERSGLVTRSRDAQSRPCHLQREPLDAALGWIDEARRVWEQRFDRLDAHLRSITAATAAEDGPRTLPPTTTKDPR